LAHTSHGGIPVANACTGMAATIIAQASAASATSLPTLNRLILIHHATLDEWIRFLPELSGARGELCARALHTHLFRGT